MRDLLFTACASGLRDGLNPCMFMTCAVFIVQGLWLRLNSFSDCYLRVVFVVAYAVSTLVFNFGPAQFVILQKGFYTAGKISYLGLSFGSFVMGVFFLKDWFLIHRQAGVPDNRHQAIKFFSARGMGVFLGTVGLAVAGSVLATLWPVEKYIIILANAAILRGVWITVMPVLITYVVFSMWAIWIMWAFLSIKNLRPSMLKIFCAAIFFAASSCVVLVFK